MLILNNSFEINNGPQVRPVHAQRLLATLPPSTMDTACRPGPAAKVNSQQYSSSPSTNVQYAVTLSTLPGPDRAPHRGPKFHLNKVLSLLHARVPAGNHFHTPASLKPALPTRTDTHTNPAGLCAPIGPQLGMRRAVCEQPWTEGNAPQNDPNKVDSSPTGPIMAHPCVIMCRVCWST
jgi:hypothetical protein